MTADAEAHGATEGEGMSVAYGTSCSARELSPEPDHVTPYGIRFLIRSIEWPLATDTVMAAKGRAAPNRYSGSGKMGYSGFYRRCPIRALSKDRETPASCASCATPVHVKGHRSRQQGCCRELFGLCLANAIRWAGPAESKKIIVGSGGK